MFLTIVDGRLIALECGLVNPLQTLALILRNACACHQKPACGKLCLGIAAIGCQLIPENALFEVLLYTIAIPVGSFPRTCSVTEELWRSLLERRWCGEEPRGVCLLV